MTSNHTVTSHLVSIKQLETQMGQILSHLNPRQQGGCLVIQWKTPKMNIYIILALWHDVN